MNLQQATPMMQRWLFDHLLLNRVHQIDALELCALLPDQSVDSVVIDPPYAEVDRDYGRMNEDAWYAMLTGCVREFRRVLKPRGSAVIVLQPNSEHVGKMRLWLWKFMVWCGEYWNIVQDAYWWNFTQPPTVHTHRETGLMRPSVKTLVWVGEDTCYRNQDAVLWGASSAMIALSSADRALKHRPSGYTFRHGRVADVLESRGGVTPFNLLPVSNTDSRSTAGAFGHGAGTPPDLAAWWIRYITPPGGIVFDPFVGSGTVAIEAQKQGRRFICGDQSAEYVAIARDRLRMPFERRHVVQNDRVDDLPLFAAVGGD